MGAACSGGAKVGAASPDDALASKSDASAEASTREQDEAERLRREAEEAERRRIREENEENKKTKEAVDKNAKELRVYEPCERVVLQPRVIAARDLPWRLWPLSEEIMKRPPTAAYCDARFKGLDDIEALDWSPLESHGRNNVSLDLSLNRLRYLPLPREETGGILALERVQSLNLSGNYLEDIRAVIACSYLEILDISSNKIADISPLNACSNLKYLNASNNCLGEGDFDPPSAPPTAAPSPPGQPRSPMTCTRTSTPRHHAADTDKISVGLNSTADKLPEAREDSSHSDGEERDKAHEVTPAQNLDDKPQTVNSTMPGMKQRNTKPQSHNNGAIHVGAVGMSSRGAEVGLGLDARELMASLLVIDISYNPGIGLQSLMHFSALRQLFCSGCGISTLLSLRGLRSLEVLVADRNSISDLIETADVVQALALLRRLDLAGNPLCSHPMYLALLLQSAADREGDFFLLEELDGRRLEAFEYSVIMEMRAIAPSIRVTASLARTQSSSLPSGGGGGARRTNALAPEVLAALEAARSRVRAKFGAKSSAFCEALLITSGENPHLLEIAGSLVDESKRASALQMDALLHYINSIPLAIVQHEEELRIVKGTGFGNHAQGTSTLNVDPDLGGDDHHHTNNSYKLNKDEENDNYDEDDWPEVPVAAPIHENMRSRV